MATSSGEAGRHASAVARKAPPGGPVAPTAAISAEERRGMIEVAAYYLAERRGFCAGCELDDWLAAEAEVDESLSAAHGRPEAKS